jgi:ribonuclease T
MIKKRTLYAQRFRGLLPIVIDVETAGLNPATDALLEIAAVTLRLNETGKLVPDQTHAFHIEPFHGANLEADALAITGIDPANPLRFAIPEAQAIYRLSSMVNNELIKTGTYKAVLVGHNAWFDLSFLLEAVKRSRIRYFPFHRFTTFDTASLAAIALGETVLARAVRRARIAFDVTQAHSAIYDAERTAELFCYIANK